ncbi:MAG: radical SAM protein [Planctomycetota bacterium]|jgi:hypothetical protein
MSEARHGTAALVPLWPNTDYMAPFGDTTVIGHTLRRLMRVDGLGPIVVLHGDEDETAHTLQTLQQDDTLAGATVTHRAGGGLADKATPARRAARKFAPRAWRGGLGGATVWDEILAPAAMVDALQAVGAAAGLLVGADWPLVDPDLCAGLIERRLSEPEQLRLVFNQAPPGLAGCVIERSLLEELIESGAMIGSLLDYQPRVPQGDPIGKAPCVQIEPAVRDASIRLTHDWPRYAQPLNQLATNTSPDDLLELSATQIVQRLVGADTHEAWPNELTLEITTARAARGPLAPAAEAIGAARPDLTVQQAVAIFEQVAREPDVALTLGGVGDPLLHPDWSAIVQAAHDAGIHGIHVRTDLIVDEDTLRKIIAAPIDVISVSLNADTPETYRALMGADEHARVVRNIEWLLNNRNGQGAAGLPWVAPRLAKTAANVAELEDFFDRWTYFAGHAVIESPPTGCGATEDLSVMPMAPPVREPCRQLRRRVTVHADGAVAMCDQDWRGRGRLGAGADLRDAWQNACDTYARHEAGDFDACEPCAGCSEWHRP